MERLAAVLQGIDINDGGGNGTQGWDEGRWRALRRAAMDGACSRLD